MHRRLCDELGVAARDLTLVLPDFSYRASDGAIEEERAMPVYVCHIDGDPTPSAGRVAEWLWWDWEAFHAAATAPDSISPWARLQASLLDPLLDDALPGLPRLPHHLKPRSPPRPRVVHLHGELFISVRRVVHLRTARCASAHGELCTCTQSAISPNDPPRQQRSANQLRHQQRQEDQQRRRPCPRDLVQHADEQRAQCADGVADALRHRGHACRVADSAGTQHEEVQPRRKQALLTRPRQGRPTPPARPSARSTPRPDADQRGRTCGERDLVPRPSGQARHHQRHGYLHQPRQ